MKATGRCRRCHQSRIGYLESLPEVAARLSYQALGTIRYRPEIRERVDDGNELTDMFLARTGVRPTFRTTLGERTLTKTGAVEAYLCAHCGLLEQYLQDPQWLQIDKLEGFVGWLADRPAGAREKDMHPRKCSKCQSTRVGRLASLPDTVSDETTVRPRYLGVTTDRQPKLVGRLSATVCADCGYLETYLEDPQILQLEKISGFSWHSAETPPYR
jgi:hypothetical protein